MIARRGFFARVAAFFGLATVGNNVSHGSSESEMQKKMAKLGLNAGDVRLQFVWDARSGYDQVQLRIYLDCHGETRGILLRPDAFEKRPAINTLVITPTEVKRFPADAVLEPVPAEKLIHAEYRVVTR